MSAHKDNSEPTPQARRPGRPRGNKPTATSREQLLDIALDLFARQGIARTS
ncbi:MAG: TetR/AcrR family transcriptional regulator, partial [Leclercia adecarboxylata]|nr:TetR/AcrR family transcriptional regulator [Leclercia adecarboxylata]